MAIKTAENRDSAGERRFAPAYSVAEAAHYLHMPGETLRSWVMGRLYPVAGQSKRSRSLIRLDDPKRQYLVEAHVLAAIRRRYGVRLPEVRNALEYLKRRFGIDRPLIDQAFQTDGVDLFVEHYGDLVNASRGGQQAIKEIISVYLRRIERDAKGLPIKFYPFTRDSESDALPESDPKLVVMNPTISFGRPVISGTGIPVSSIYERYKAGDSVADLARDFNLETGAVEEAIRCEAA
jgi:uncharacterized protein (DUF433 family)